MTISIIFALASIALGYLLCFSGFKEHIQKAVNRGFIEIDGKTYRIMADDELKNKREMLEKTITGIPQQFDNDSYIAGIKQGLKDAIDLFFENE